MPLRGIYLTASGPEGLYVPVLTGNPADDGYAIGAGTGRPLTVSSVGSGLARDQSVPTVPKLVVPIALLGWMPFSSAGVATMTANRIQTMRVIIPFAGTLHDLSWFVGTASGNLIAAIYDTGDALAGSRSQLYSSGSIAAAGTNAWQTVDPALSVSAGQQLEFALLADNSTVTVGRTLALAATGMPNTSFVPCAGGASPKLSAAYLIGSFTMPSAITEAQLSTQQSMLNLIARVA